MPKKISGAFKFGKILCEGITSTVYKTKSFLYHEYFDSYILKIEKMLKIAVFVNFGPKYLGPQIFPRHAVCGSKLEI